MSWIGIEQTNKKHTSKQRAKTDVVSYILLSVTAIELCTIHANFRETNTHTACVCTLIHIRVLLCLHVYMPVCKFVVILLHA